MQSVFCEANWRAREATCQMVDMDIFLSMRCSSMVEVKLIMLHIRTGWPRVFRTRLPEMVFIITYVPVVFSAYQLFL